MFGRNETARGVKDRIEIVRTERKAAEQALLLGHDIARGQAGSSRYFRDMIAAHQNRKLIGVTLSSFKVQGQSSHRLYLLQ